MNIYVSKPVFYGLLYAAVYGLAIFLFSFPAIYLMIRPGVDFMFAWKAVLNETVTGVICFNIFGFLYGWHLGKSDRRM